MLMSLLLLAEDARNAKYLSTTDCVVARAAKRVINPKFHVAVDSKYIGIYNEPHTPPIIDCRLSRDFCPSEMDEMARLNENRTIQVEIPDEFLL